MAANTSAGDKNIGLKYEEPQPQHRQRIKNKPKHDVVGTHSEKYDEVSQVKKSLSENSSLLYGLYLFSRPHTILGTILGITSVSTLALNSWTQVSPVFLLEVLKAIVPTFLMNIYVVGLNQIYDVEIDKVNKPYLPLASGVMSMELGVGVVVTSLIMSLALGMLSGSPALMVALLCLFLVGSVYSIELPLMRWKRNPFLAATAIVLARALVIQFAYFIHIQVFWMCINILMAAYGGAMAFGVSSSSLSNKIVTVLGHFSLASLLMYRALRSNISTPGSVYGFYMFIWKCDIARIMNVTLVIMDMVFSVIEALLNCFLEKDVLELMIAANVFLSNWAFLNCFQFPREGCSSIDD
ncbi:homogentisate geranylgeranyltransferase, chloroplastic-like [Henckelia pumila]|uniref:homogentisate geranylgeranyltransferase, chloroplastic-like n=1 Tax=Henckelia pumila TaxID=405737 RepID=UPI003C6E1757